MTSQSAILQSVPAVGRYLFFSVASLVADDIRQSLALFGISKPLTGTNFCCPPMRAGRLDVCQLGLSGDGA